MREILFRGKRKTGEWIEGSLVVSNGPVNVGRCYNLTQFSDMGDKIGGFYEVVPETVGQFTGLCDRNGKRIFEGDIISCFYENLLVEWDAGAFQSSNHYKLYPLDHFVARNCEVAGNIHDNPNLIEGGGEDGI